MGEWFHEGAEVGGGAAEEVTRHENEVRDDAEEDFLVVKSKETVRRTS